MERGGLESGLRVYGGWMLDLVQTQRRFFNEAPTEVGERQGNRCGRKIDLDRGDARRPKDQEFLDRPSVEIDAVG